MISAQSPTSSGTDLVAQADRSQPHWYAAYTFPRHEKCVALQLQRRGFDHFLPLHQEVHRWKDRRKIVELALFPGYVFVRMSLKEKLGVLQTASVARLVSFQGRPAALPDAEIEALRNGLAVNLRAEPHPYLELGRKVQITGGPMAGATGILVRRKQSFRVVLSIAMIQRSVAVEIDVRDIAPVF
jgi:transcription antitermination factor NusG